MKAKLSVLLALCGVALATPARAQLLPGIALMVEAHPSAGVPVSGFGQADPGVAASSGYGFGAGGSVGVGPVALYGEYQWMRFGCTQCGEAGLDDGVVDRGWEAGARLGLPLALLPVRPWIRAGVVGHQLRFSGLGDHLTADQALGVGVGAGVTVPFGRFLRVEPRLSYRRYDADFTFENAGLPGRDTPVSYLALDLAVALQF